MVEKCRCCKVFNEWYRTTEKFRTPWIFLVVVVVVFLDSGSCSVTKLWGGDVPASVRDCSKPRFYQYCYVLSILSHGFNCFMYLSLSPPVSQLPPHTPPIDWDATLFIPNYPPYSSLGTPADLDKRTLPPASTARTYAWYIVTLDLILRSLLSPAAPSHDPVSAISSPGRSPPFLCPRCCYISVYPGGFALVGSVLPKPFLNLLFPSPPPFLASTCGPVPAGAEGGRVSSSWPPILPRCASSSPAPKLPFILVSSVILSS